MSLRVTFFLAVAIWRSVSASSCNQDNCLRAFVHTSISASSLCKTYTLPGAPTTLPTFASQCSYLPSKVSSACSCLMTGSTTSSSALSLTVSQLATASTTSSIPLLPPISTSSAISTVSTTFSTSTVAAVNNCNQDNCLRAFLHTSVSASSFCQTYTVLGEPTTLPTYASECSYLPSRVSSACSCLVTGKISQSTPSTQSASTTVNVSSRPSKSSAAPSTFSSITDSSSAAATTSNAPDSAQTAAVTVLVSDSGNYTISGSVAPAQTIVPSNSIPTVTDINLIAAATQRPIAWAHNSQSDGSIFSLVMSLTALDESTLVNIEDFLPFVSSVSCGPETIAVAFNSPAAFTLAVDSWPLNFTLVTSGSEYCGTDVDSSGRTFYNVVTWTSDAPTDTISLTVTVSTFQQSISAINATFGTTPSDNSSSAVPKRDLTGSNDSTQFQLNSNNFFNYVDNNNIVNPSVVTEATGQVTCDGCGFTGYFYFGGAFDCALGLTILDCGENRIALYYSGGPLVLDYWWSVTPGVKINDNFFLDDLKLPSLSIGSGYTQGFFSLDAGAVLQSTVVADPLASSFDAQGFGATFPYYHDFSMYMDIYGETGNTLLGDTLPVWQMDAEYQYYAPQVSFTSSIGPYIEFTLTLFEESDYQGYFDLQTPTLTFNWYESMGCAVPPEGTHGKPSPDGLVMHGSASMVVTGSLKGPVQFSNALNDVTFFTSDHNETPWPHGVQCVQVPYNLGVAKSTPVPL